MSAHHLDLEMEHPKSPAFALDSATFAYDPFSHVDYLQYPAFTSTINASSPRMFANLNLAGSDNYSYSGSPAYTTNAPSPARPFTPIDSISPPALNNLSGGELSGPEHLQSGRISRGSTTSASDASVVPRALRYNPIARPASSRKQSTSSASARQVVKDVGSDDDDDDEFQPRSSGGRTSGGNSDNRREEIRRQRIESEQRRRDELREGYRRLKDALPVSNQKSSKVSLLDRATTHVKYLEIAQQQLQARLVQAEAEVHHLRSINEKLMLSAAGVAATTISST